MTARNHALFWFCAFAGFLAFVYVFKAVLLPFVLGIAIAYLLNPLVNTLGRAKIKRAPAAMLILAVFFLALGSFLALLTPLLYKQAIQLAEEIPHYMDTAIAFLEPYSQKAFALIGQDNETDIKSLLGNHLGTAANVTQQVLQSLAAGGQAFFGFMSVMVFTPIVAYFMMKEWNNITIWVEDVLPQHSKKTIKDLLSQVDQKLSGFVRGQISVAIILGVMYALALSIAGLKYGILIGLLSGLLSIIPMVGSAVGLVVSIMIAWFQAGDLAFVAIIAAIFLIGQLVEGNILSPKIVGDSVGLHPLWVFFALLAGSALFGILGMLLAVPVAAVAGVLLAFAITQYKASPYYKGVKTKEAVKPGTKKKPNNKAINKPGNKPKKKAK